MSSQVTIGGFDNESDDESNTYLEQRIDIELSKSEMTISLRRTRLNPEQINNATLVDSPQRNPRKVP
jgi:hypothetical protein